jgi:hypothetical protein
MVPLSDLWCRTAAICRAHHVRTRQGSTIQPPPTVDTTRASCGPVRPYFGLLALLGALSATSLCGAQDSPLQDDPFGPTTAPAAAVPSLDAPQTRNESNPFGELPAPAATESADNAETQLTEQAEPPEPANAKKKPKPPTVTIQQVTPARLEEALSMTTPFEFRDAPLSEVVDFIQSTRQVPVFIDIRALDDVGMGADSPVTISLKGASLQSAMAHMLRELELTMTIRDSVVVITTPEEAENDLIVKMYQVADLITPPKKSDLFGEQGAPALDALVETITTVVAPDSWDEVGGAGTINDEVEWGLLAVAQTHDVHQQIESLLAAIREASKHAEDQSEPGEDTPRAKSYVVAVGESERQAYQRIQQALSQTTSLEFMDAPLSEVVDYLKSVADIPILIDRRALDEIGIGTDAPVTISLEGISLNSALKLLLRQLELTVVIDDEALVITTAEEAETRREIRVYAVPDLKTPAYLPFGDPQFATPATDQKCLDNLIKWLTSTIEPNSWDEVGGPGSLATLDDRGVLVVSQSLQVQEKIAQFFQHIRAAKVEPIHVPEQQPEPVDPRNATATNMVVRLYAINPHQAHMEQIIEAIKSSVAPAQWRADASIKAVGTTLVVRQTDEMHRQVYELLEQLNMLSFGPHFGMANGMGMSGSMNAGGMF